MTPRTTCLATLAIGALALPGCGGSDGPAGTNGTATATGTTAAPTTTAAPRAATVEIKDFMFAPPTVTVAAGGTVTWTNRDDAPHTATATGAFDTGTIRTGRSAQVTAKQAGRVPYVCAFHPYMKGTLVVQG